MSLHEYGHGLDSNDGGGGSPDNGTGETYGDFTAALSTHNSCVGNGFLGGNCPGYGNACTSCTGVRDIDWAKHSRNTPSTVQNFTRNTCPTPSANNPNYVGPCGRDAMNDGVTSKKREGHCESYVSSEALWDLANRDLPSPGSGSAWSTADRLWYLSRSTASAAFVCETSGGTATSGTWTSSGCSTGSLFRVFRTVDDDDGNLTNGTPHGGAIFAAMDRHGIACTTDAGANVTFASCAPPAAPSLSLAAGNNAATISWSGSTGVYDIYRNETGCNAGFTKVVNDRTTSPYTDAAVANGLTYFYQVVAQPSGNESCASAPSSCLSVTPTSSCTPPGVPSGLSATAAGETQVNLSWGSVAGATQYIVFRATSSGGPYTQIGTPTSNSFSDTGRTCNTTYFYVVQASNGSCASANSAQAQATTATCTTCTPPAAPTGVNATAASPTQINVGWSASSGATSYAVLRSTTSGGPYSQIGTSATTSFSDTTASCNTAYFYVVTASNGTCSSGNSAQATATSQACVGNVLTKGVPVTGIGGATGNDQFWTMNVPAGSTNLTFNTSGGTGDVDLYVRFGSPPTTTTFDCKSEGAATTESCTIPAPAAGTWHVLLHAFSTYSGASLVGNYTTGGGGGELITNGGFETGTAPWVFSGNASRSTGAFPHLGTAYSILAGVNNAVGAEYQQIAIPSTATGTLTFWTNITSAETTTTTVYDRMFVEVRNTAGTLLATLATYSNLDKVATSGAYVQKTLNVAAYKGQTVRIQFRTTSDTSLITSFRVDDVSVQ